MKADEGSGKITIYGLHNPNDTNLYSKTIRNFKDIVDLTAERGINFIFVQYALRKTYVLRNVLDNFSLHEIHSRYLVNPTHLKLNLKKVGHSLPAVLGKICLMTLVFEFLKNLIDRMKNTFLKKISCLL